MSDRVIDSKLDASAVRRNRGSPFWLDAPTCFGGLSKLLRIKHPSQMAFWILFAGLASVIILIRVSNVFNYHPVFSAYAALVGALIIARYVFFALYNPELLPLMSYQPHVAVIIPARNESRGIYSTARSLAAQDYPKEKLTVILLDGSGNQGLRPQGRPPTGERRKKERNSGRNEASQCRNHGIDRQRCFSATRCA